MAIIKTLGARTAPGFITYTPRQARHVPGSRASKAAEEKNPPSEKDTMKEK